MQSIPHPLSTAALFAAVALTYSCSNNSSSRLRHETSWEEMSVGQRLEVIRNDISYITYLDSCAHLHIGADAVCKDAVRHLFECKGSWWIYSEDWGGLLEIPGGWIPEVDTLQTELTFHGTSVWSPDSLSLVQMYSGMGFRDEVIAEQSIVIDIERAGISISSLSRNLISLAPGTESVAITVSGNNFDGTLSYIKYIPKGPDGVEYRASVQWKPGAVDIESILRSIDRFPFGPEDQCPYAEALNLSRQL